MKFPSRPTRVTKAAVQALSSIWGSVSTALTRPLPASRWGFMREPFSGAWQAGAVQVDPLGDLTVYGAAYACISRISNDIAKLEPRLMQQDGGIWVPAPNTSPHWRPLKKPNHFQNRIQFYAYWLVCKLIHGNAYALKVRDDARQMVTGLYLLDPRMVTPLVTPEGDVYYRINGDDLARIPGGVTVPASEIIHDRINCLWHPLVGIAPIIAAGASITQGRRIQSNSAKFFENMSRPSGVLTAPGTIDPVTAERLQNEWNRNFSGGNIGKLAVLGDGLEYEPMTIPAEQAQLMDQQKWTVEDVARCFHMPLYKIGAGSMPTNSNVEALNQQYYDDCLQPHIEAIEVGLDEGLMTPANSRVEFDLRGLLRMDQTAHVKMLAEGVGGAIMTPNEARAELNLAPIAGGSTVYLQQQNFSLAALAKRDASPDPFAKTAKPPAAPAAPSPAPAPEKFDVDLFVKAMEEAEIVCA